MVHKSSCISSIDYASTSSEGIFCSNFRHLVSHRVRLWHECAHLTLVVEPVYSVRVLGDSVFKALEESILHQSALSWPRNT